MDRSLFIFSLFVPFCVILFLFVFYFFFFFFCDLLFTK